MKKKQRTDPFSGTRYFTCAQNKKRHPKLPYGVFVRETQIRCWEHDSSDDENQ